MIVTVTLNPSLDRTIDISALARGAVIRAASARLDPAGKGVNVARALLANGKRSRAVLSCGGDDGQRLVRMLAAEGVDMLAVPIAGSTRSNITLSEPDGTVTKINELGPSLSKDELDTVAAAVLDCDVPGGWVAVCGSLPPGVPADAYADLCVRFRAAGRRVAVDTSGAALLDAVAAGPAVVKPNQEELGEAVGAPLRNLGEVIEAAQQLRTWGAGAVLASLGAHGAVLVDDHGAVMGDSPVLGPRSTVGAGDALLAGFLAAGARGPEALAEALAWGAAAVSLPGSRMPRAEDIRRDRVRIHNRPDFHRAMTLPLPA
ncbi:PfkB domain protein [Parafrankia sp. EAN1pec]|uniref:1-phosphofructokinase n=1 Tax=Parafrankia sp. (strain EAN1pec) TaxID=298653 RepID=UPI00005418FE|nr:PfkB domain protein [Frankia sp. EAN1pec]